MSHLTPRGPGGAPAAGPNAPPPPPHQLVCAVAALAIPGLGHLLLGMQRRAGQFFLALVGTFALGMWMSKGYAVSAAEHPLALCLQLPAMVPTLIGQAIDMSRAPSQGPRIPPIEVVAMLDLGMLYTMVAGLLNLVLIHDAWDRAAARRSA